ncbi:MAG: WD40 repeat domain-containing protein [Hyphomicrobiaceae bacterium]
MTSEMTSAPLNKRYETKQVGWPAAITGLHWGGDSAMFALGDGTVRFWRKDEEDATVVEAHEGAILTVTCDAAGTGLLSGGDDGVLLHTTESGRNIIARTGRRWIDQIALAPWGGLAWAHGKTVEIAHGKMKQSRTLFLPSSCGGLAFAPKGERLAIAHYGGATIASLAHPNSDPDRCEWKGAHIAITWSPDARFLVTAMQEQAVHVWRLSDGGNLHMGGYPTKPKSFSWSPKGHLLATSGGPSALIWPFKGRSGPQGEMAQQAGGYLSPVSAVSWHPVSNVLAIGHRDGVIALAGPGSERSLYLREPDGGAITHVAWRADGAILAFGSERGSAGLIDCTGLART